MRSVTLYQAVHHLKRVKPLQSEIHPPFQPTHLQIHSGKTEPFSFRQITNEVGSYLKGGGELPQCLTHFAKDAGSI